MNRSTFDFLEDEDKMNFITKSCSMVAKRRHKNFCYELYQVDGFYIELQIYTQHPIWMRFHCFDDMSYLEPYLTGIDVSGVIH